MGATQLAGTGMTHFQPLTSFNSKANSPYGMPIVDDCGSCKLRCNSFFCSLSNDSLRDLDAIKHTTSYPEGALVFVEGQAARGVFVLCQGRAKLMATSRDGRTLILKIAEPGEILGLHAVVGGTAYEVTVETLQPSQLAFIGRDEFVKYIKTHGDACLHAAQHLSRDCQAAYDSMRSIGLSHSVTEKLARLLLQWSSNARVVDGALRTKLALTHEEIAQLIGSSRETVTRTLADFKKRHVAELHGSTLLIWKRAELEGLATC
ncbi:MAG TPA: Crp/Fnr family transcriptional regulator [Terriglobales bacterium]